MSAAPELLTGFEVLGPGVSRMSPREIAAAGFLARFRVKTTRDGYRLALQQWFAFADEHFIDVMSAKRSEIEVWARYLEDARGLSQSTIAGKLNGLAGFYRFAVADDLITKNPMVHVVRPKIPRESTTNGLSRTEFADLLNAADRGSLQDQAVICLLGLNGMRVSEACGIDVEHLSRYKGQLVVAIRRKGGKTQQLPLPPRTTWVVEQLRGQRVTGPLLRSRTGKRMDQKGADRIVKRVARAAGITKRMHPHVLRHAYVTMGRELGISDADIASSAGWADARMATYYDTAAERIERNPTHAIAAFVERAT